MVLHHFGTASVSVDYAPALPQGQAPPLGRVSVGRASVPASPDIAPTASTPWPPARGGGKLHKGLWL